MARMLLVDGSNHAFRVQFALPPRHASDGFPTRVLYGFTLLFQKMLRTWQPDYVVVSFDTGRNFREDLFPAYKGHRPDMPDDLRRQWPYLPELVEAFGYRSIAVEGYEADDVLGTLASRFGGEDCEVFLVTSDKDFCQLVNDHVRILDEAKNEILDEDGVVDKFGVGPELVIDLLGLAGDTSDNIPGVTKVGVKTASKLIGEHGTLEGVLQAAAEGRIKGKTGERLVAEADNARLSRRLVTIDTQVPLDVTLDELRPRPLDEERLRELFDRWEFGQVARKLLPERETVEVTAFTSATTPEEVAAALERVRAGDLTTFDLACDGQGLAPAPIGAAFGSDHGAGVWVGFDVPGARDAVLDVLADPEVPKVAYDAKQVHRSLAVHGRGLAGLRDDVRLIDYAVASHRRDHGLGEQASRHLGHTLGQARAAAAVEGDPIAADAAERANVVAQLVKRLVSRLEPGPERVYREIELPLVPVLAQMELAGIRLDRERLAEVDEEMGRRLEAVEAECVELGGKTFNIRSRHELRDLLFDDLGLTPGKKVKDGFSTASDVLEKIVDEHPIVAKVLEYRALDKLRGTYTSKLAEYIGADGRVHTTFNQAMAATGRLSSVDPNLQNIPIRTAEGRRIRECFVPEPGWVFLSADYSQVELRVLAHVTGDPVLMEGFRAGEDIHRRTAVEVFGVAPDQVSIAQRSAAKAINFGLLYGMSAFRLSNDLQIDRDEAQAYMERYFARMPRVQGWIEDTRAACRRDGHVETIFGRRRLIPEIHSSNWQERSAGEREAVNTVIQGTAADLIKLAMLRVHRALGDAGLQARMVLQVHDELLLEVPEAEVDAATALVRREMEQAATLEVPLAVTTSTGRNWNEAHG